MSEAIYIQKFSQSFILYTFISLSVDFLTGFTISAALVYLFILLPFYLLCVVHVISLAQKYRQSLIRYHKALITPIAIFQILIIISSPSSCAGVKQGEACQSLIGSLLTDMALNRLPINIPDWGGIESIFPIAILIYMILIGLFLGSSKIEPI